MSLPPTYTNELNTLNREILKAQPPDVLQFCANFFNRRLESQRREYLLSAQSGGGIMAESSFPGGNPFGGAGQRSPTSSGGMQQLREEDELEPTMSPTNPTFQNTPFSQSKDAPTSGAFNNDGAFGSSFSPSAGVPPSSFKPTAATSGEGFPSNYSLGRRTSVSAESMNPQSSADDNWKPPYHAKTPDQLARLKAAVANNFLFSHLDDEQTSQVLGALVEKPIPAKGIKIITQGDAGDYFYIVEKGHFDVYINKTGSVQPGPEGMGTKVADIGPGGSFGELALMYNAPRAATIISTEPGSLLWALDRITFRRILMDSAFARRRMYENFLNEVPLLASLEPYQHSKIADSLETQKFPAGSTIIREGDRGEAFYLLESGTAAAYKKETGDKILTKYKKGDYFGELALLDDKPRAASVVSLEEVKVAMLGKEGFQRLLGPVNELMRQNDPSKRGVGAGAAGAVEGVDLLSK